MKPTFEELESIFQCEFKYIKSKKKLFVKAKDGFFQLELLKPACSKVQDGPAFWNGQKLKDKGIFKNEA